MIKRTASGLSLKRAAPFLRVARCVMVGYGRVPVGRWIKAKLILKKPLPAYKTTTTRRHPMRINLCRNGFRPSPL